MTGSSALHCGGLTLSFTIRQHSPCWAINPGLAACHIVASNLNEQQAQDTVKGVQKARAVKIRHSSIGPHLSLID